MKNFSVGDKFEWIGCIKSVLRTQDKEARKKDKEPTRN